ncbi:MAG: CAP domain-containing protein [Pseudomonadota bacterium]
MPTPRVIRLLTSGAVLAALGGLACAGGTPEHPSLRTQLEDSDLAWDDPRHVAAARSLAAAQLDDETLRARAPQALAEAGAPASLVAVVRGDDPDLHAALARLAPARCGQAGSSPTLTLCSRVLVDFTRLPTRLRPGEPLHIEGRVLGSARLREVLLLTSEGVLHALPVQAQGRDFSIETNAPRAMGWHTLEVMVSTERGVEVAALWDLKVGDAAPLELFRDAPDPADGDAGTAAQRAFEGLQRDRQAAGQAPLIWSEVLAQRARERAEELAGRDVLEHGTGKRLESQHDDAGQPLVWLGENLARARSVQGARRALMHSPSHRRNRLHVVAQQGAVGVAWRGRGADRTLFLVELLARSGEELDENGVVRALRQRVDLARNGAGRRALDSDAALDRLARHHAQLMCQSHALVDEVADGARLTQAVLDARPDLVRAGAALFLVVDPAMLEISATLTDPRYDLAGAGAARCENGQPWYAVVLVAQRERGSEEDSD